MPDKPAVIMARSGAVVTYGELDYRSNQLAQLLRHRGLREGDAIAICMENNERFYELVWAAQRSGLYYTPVNSRLTAGEAAYIVEDCGACALIVSGARRDLALAIGTGLPQVTVRLPGRRHQAPAGWQRHYDDAVAGYPGTEIDGGNSREWRCSIPPGTHRAWGQGESAARCDTYRSAPPTWPSS